MRNFLTQWRKPTGRLGRALAWVFNFSHANGSNWGLQHLGIAKDSVILDVGCGGGAFVYDLARLAPQGKVYGLDYSEDSVFVARWTNRRWIRLGRVEILPGSVSCLSFSDTMFDLVTAVNSHYYWPDLAKDMQEVKRVLKPGGALALIGEAYKGGKYEQRDRKFVETLGLAYFNAVELRRLFVNAGYAEIQLFEEYDRGWIFGSGKKPQA